MRKLLVLALMVVGITTFAQEKEGKLAGGKTNIDPSKRAEMQAQKLKADLGLNDDQTLQIKNFLTQQVKDREAKRLQMQDIRNSGQKPTEDQKKEMKSKIESERKLADDQMKKILTPQQFEKWKSNMEERREKIKKRLVDEMPAGQIEKK